MRIIKNKLKLILGEIFIFLGLVNLSALLLESIKPMIVTAYINTGYLLIFWLIIGIIQLLIRD